MPHTPKLAVRRRAAATPAFGAAANGADTSHLLAVLEALKPGLFTFDETMQVLFCSDRLGAALEIPRNDLLLYSNVQQLVEASPLLTVAAVHQVCEACLTAASGADAGSRTLVVSSEDPERAFTIDITQISQRCWLCVFEEVTGRRAAEAKALHQALRDPLTGLPNRQLFADSMAEALAGAGLDALAEEAPALMMIDLDRFKAVNDTLGHPVGDALLCLVAQRLRSIVRANDVVARLGGDEFAVLLAPLDYAGVDNLSRRVVDLLGRPYLIEGHLVNIGASAGVARFPFDGQDGTTLMRHADLALYYVKSSGRNGFSFFEPSMGSRAQARRSLEIDLRRALKLGEFELFYQAQVDLALGAVTGFEALIRWRHPERGIVAPNEFIPLAEDIGLIVPLGEWVLREACCEAMKWPDSVSVAVNVSPRQFDDKKLADSIADALRVAGLPGYRLEIEITESALVRNQDAVLETLRRVRALGARVAMDDFGTGYSSLSQLRVFPFDKIKIDRSFVTSGAHHSDDAIIRAITAMGATLGLDTIAEGVETAAQLARLRLEGCGSVQGFLFGRPVPAGEVEGLMARIASHATDGT